MADPLVLARHRGRVSGIVLSDWGRVLLSAGSDGMVRVWDVSTDVPQIVQRHSRAGVRVLLSADGATVASLARDSPDLRVSSGSSHAHLLIPYRHGLADIAFGPRPGEITGAQVDGAVRVWSWRTDRLRTMPATGFTCGAPSH